MKAFVINRGKRYEGRVLAHDEADALKKAKDFWGPGKYKAAPVIVQKAMVVSAPAGDALVPGEELEIETIIHPDRLQQRILSKSKRKT